MPAVERKATFLQRVSLTPFILLCLLAALGGMLIGLVLSVAADTTLQFLSDQSRAAIDIVFLLGGIAAPPIWLVRLRTKRNASGPVYSDATKTPSNPGSVEVGSPVARDSSQLIKAQLNNSSALTTLGYGAFCFAAPIIASNVWLFVIVMFLASFGLESGPLLLIGSVAAYVAGLVLPLAWLRQRKKAESSHFGMGFALVVVCGWLSGLVAGNTSLFKSTDLRVQAYNDILIVQNVGAEPVTIRKMTVNNRGDCFIGGGLLGERMSPDRFRVITLKVGDKQFFNTSCGIVRVRIDTDKRTEQYDFQ